MHLLYLKACYFLNLVKVITIKSAESFNGYKDLLQIKVVKSWLFCLYLYFHLPFTNVRWFNVQYCLWEPQKCQWKYMVVGNSSIWVLRRPRNFINCCFLFPKSIIKPIWKFSLSVGSEQTENFHVWWKGKFSGGIWRALTQVSWVLHSRASLPAATHTYPDFIQVERNISSLQCRAGKILDVYNIIIS